MVIPLKSNQYYHVLIQKNFLNFHSWVIVGIGIQTHKEKEIIVGIFFSAFQTFYSTMLATIYFYA